MLHSFNNATSTKASIYEEIDKIFKNDFESRNILLKMRENDPATFHLIVENAHLLKYLAYYNPLASTTRMADYAKVSMKNREHYLKELAIQMEEVFLEIEHCTKDEQIKTKPSFSKI